MSNVLNLLINYYFKCITLNCLIILRILLKKKQSTFCKCLVGVHSFHCRDIFFINGIICGHCCVKIKYVCKNLHCKIIIIIIMMTIIIIIITTININVLLLLLLLLLFCQVNLIKNKTEICF